MRRGHASSGSHRAFAAPVPTIWAPSSFITAGRPKSLAPRSLMAPRTSAQSRRSGRRASVPLQPARTLWRPDLPSSGSVEQVGVGMADLLPHGLEAQPPGFGETGLLERVRGHRVVNLLRRSCCHGQQLCLTGALHREEPETGFVDGLADGEQTMVLMDGGLAGREHGGQLLAGLEVEYDCATLLGDDPVVAVEDA